MAARSGWGRGFDPDRLASLELQMWKAYYRRQNLRLLGLLVLANREQARAGWPRSVLAAFWFARAAAGFGRSTGDYDRFRPDIGRGYRALGLPDEVDPAGVAARELRWWSVRREIGLSSGRVAGDAIASLYAALYGLPEAVVADAGRLRGEAAEVRDRGATADPAGPGGPGAAYWPEVGRLLRASYRSLAAAVAEPAATADDSAATRSNDYHFITRWHIRTTPAEIAEVLGDAAALARWWPSVYLAVDVLEPGDGRGLGKVVDLYTKGWLPYTLRWQFRVTESDPPNGFAIEATGDFVGRGTWRLDQESGPDDEGGVRTLVEYDWRIRAEKGILKWFSFVMKPIFSANHRWAMARGEESLGLEIARRHAGGDAAVLGAIPRPPGPTFCRRRPIGTASRDHAEPGLAGPPAPTAANADD